MFGKIHRFFFRQYKNRNVSIFWENREDTVLKGEKAQKFIARIEGVNEFGSQMVMAKITGNFKRGNERLGKEKGK